MRDSDQIMLSTLATQGADGTGKVVGRPATWGGGLGSRNQPRSSTIRPLKPVFTQEMVWGMGSGCLDFGPAHSRRVWSAIKISDHVAADVMSR